MPSYAHCTIHAQAGIKDTFFKELRSRHITSVDVVSPCCIVAAVGDGMSNTTGEHLQPIYLTAQVSLEFLASAGSSCVDANADH
jgi:hypothetical protein